MATTYDLIKSDTLASAQASYTFTSIPSTYTDLRLVSSLQTTDAGTVYDLKITVNGDTTSGLYSDLRIYGDGTSATSTKTANQNAWIQNGVNAASATALGMITLDFMSYANTSIFKTMLMRATPSANYAIALVNLWRNAAAINSITITPYGGGNIVAGSTFTLYGIKGA